MTEKIEFEFISDNQNEMRPVLPDSTPNVLEDGHMATEEEVVSYFDKLFDETNDSSLQRKEPFDYE